MADHVCPAGRSLSAMAIWIPRHDDDWDRGRLSAEYFRHTCPQPIGTLSSGRALCRPQMRYDVWVLTEDFSRGGQVSTLRSSCCRWLETNPGSPELLSIYTLGKALWVREVRWRRAPDDGGLAPVANAPKRCQGIGTSPWAPPDKVVAGAVLLPIALFIVFRLVVNPKRRSGSG